MKLLNGIMTYIGGITTNSTQDEKKRNSKREAW